MNNPARILIVDDNAANREILIKRLQPQGYEFLQAADGEEALAIATRSIPDLILLDVGMPGLDGPRTFALLKSFDPGVPCYFMSGDCYPYTRQGLLEMGARDLLEKPFVMVSLPDILHEFRLEPVQ